MSNFLKEKKNIKQQRQQQHKLIFLQQAVIDLWYIVYKGTKFQTR